MLPDPLARLNASRRAAAMPPFHAMAMSKLAEDRARAGHDVLHLEVGQPSSPAPATVRAAAVRALETQPIGYTNASGLPGLRRAIAAHYHDWYGVDVEPESILIVSGASAGFSLAFLAAFDPGDRVGVVEPGYPCYRNALEALGCVAVPIPVDESTRWAPTPELLDAVGPLDGLIIASPSNPTGTMLELDGIASYCRANGIRLISDEIYHGITFTSAARTALAADTEAVVINSFSKYFSMTGWRLGWIVAPPDLRAALERLQQNLYICAPTLSQIAAVAAFDAHEELAGHVERYRNNRGVLLEGLVAAGVSKLAAPDGAFYLYAEVGHLTDDSMALCRRWLDEIGVCATPGIDFDPHRGHRLVRFSYAGDERDLVAACDRLGRWRP